MLQRVRALATLVLFVALVPVQAHAAQRYALIVGVSSYTAPLSPLSGPRNDVTLLVSTLVARGWIGRDHIMVLADGLANASYAAKIKADGRPTRSEIQSGLDWLAKVAGPGDDILVYLSGHGSYVPSFAYPGDAPEPDGVDEVFLPIDIGAWSAGDHGLRNQLSDNDLGRSLTAIRSKGAFVWFVADSCNSGTLSRSDLILRSADPVTQLGVPRASLPAARALRSHDAVKPPGAQPAGGFVGFYAAQPSMDAIEAPVPLGASKPSLRAHGLLTWYMLRALRTGQTSSFDRIARSILAGYSEWPGTAPVPLFDGDLQRATGFSGSESRMFGVAPDAGSIFLGAGQLDGIETGAGFEIVDLRSDPPKVVGTAAAERADPDRALLRIDKASPGTAAQLAAAIMQSSSSFGARLVRRAVPFRLSVAIDALPAGANAEDRALHGRAAQILAALLSVPPERQEVPLAASASPASADVRLIVRDRKLWFGGPSGTISAEDGAAAPSIEAGGLTTDKFSAVLARLAHARNLLRVANLIEPSQISQKLAVQVFRSPQRKAPDGCAMAARGPPTVRGSLIFSTGSSAVAPGGYSSCDVLTIAVTSHADVAIDVTPLHVDGWSRIRFVSDYQDGIYEGLRIEPEATGLVYYREQRRAGAPLGPPGRGAFVLIGTPSDENAPFASDFRDLASDTASPLRADQFPSDSPGFLLAAAATGSGKHRGGAETTQRVAARLVPIHLRPEP